MNCKWNFSCETITPDVARSLLENNTGNRNIRKSVVARYAMTMASGNWLLSPEGLCIAHDGRLLNGQHRLSAVVASDVAVQFLVIRNVDPGVFKVLDRGVVRTISDAIGVPRKVAEIGRISALMINPHTQSNSVVEDASVEFFSRLLQEEHDALMVACGTSSRTFSSAPFRLAACVRTLAGFDPDYVRSVYRNLVLGHIADLPPIAQAAVGSVMANRWDRGRGSQKQKDDLARAWDLFDPSKSQNHRVLLKKHDRAISEIVTILRVAASDLGDF